MARNIEAIIRNANICSRNFAGRAGRYNKEGERSFTIILDEEQGENMIADGWNVKKKDGREPGDPPRYYLGVSVSFSNPRYQPTLVMVTSSNKVVLNEETCGRLDGGQFEKIDISLNGRVWEAADGKTGIKAYLKSGYFTIVEDKLAEEYGMYE